jgi:hypothetical protein
MPLLSCENALVRCSEGNACLYPQHTHAHMTHTHCTGCCAWRGLQHHCGCARGGRGACMCKARWVYVCTDRHWRIALYSTLSFEISAKKSGNFAMPTWFLSYAIRQLRCMSDVSSVCDRKCLLCVTCFMWLCFVCHMFCVPHVPHIDRMCLLCATCFVCLCFVCLWCVTCFVWLGVILCHTQQTFQVSTWALSPCDKHVGTHTPGFYFLRIYEL